MTAKRTRIAIVGCRPAERGSTGWATWCAIRDDVRAFVDTLAPDVVVVSGGAAGVDTVAVDRAIERRLAVHEPWRGA